jgi:hypothetical protein
MNCLHTAATVHQAALLGGTADAYAYVHHICITLQPLTSSSGSMRAPDMLPSASHSPCQLLRSGPPRDRSRLPLLLLPLLPKRLRPARVGAGRMPTVRQLPGTESEWYLVCVVWAAAHDDFHRPLVQDS